MTNSKLKLLILGSLPPPVNGATIYFSTILKSAIAQEFEITLLDLKFAKTIGDYGNFSLIKILRLISYCLQLCFILATKKIDMVYAHISYHRISFAKDITLMAISRLFGKKVVVCILGIGLERLYQNSGRFMRWFIRWGVGLGMYYVTPSLKMFERHYSSLIPVEKVRCVPFGIFTGANKSINKRIDNFEAIKVVYYSHFIKTKGIDDVLAAVPLVVQKNPNVKFTFVGTWDTEDHKKEALAILENETIDIKNRVEFSGLVTGDGEKACLKESDIFILPTYFESEGLPLSILEAMSYGCAIIATDHSGISVAVEDEVNGLICRPHDPIDIAQKINRLIDDRQLLYSLQENSLRIFHESFTAEKFSDNLVAVLKSL